ncbi:MAG: aspartate/glutamate racemase family protein [Burkholderiaceae bacterium]
MTPLIGILGGMGPLAAVDLMQKMIEETGANSDQRQIPVLCWNVPQVPDRQKALDGAGTSPLPAMQAGIGALNRAGATRIVIACNTAHFWFDALAKSSRAPLIHIADAALAYLEASQVGQRPPEPRGRLAKVGLIATDGTLGANFYQSRFAARGITCVGNTPDEQRRLFTPGCYAIKRGRMDEGSTLLQAAAQCLVDRGAERLVLACTEVPIALRHAGSAHLASCIDPTRALAWQCARYWLQTAWPD